MTCVVDATPDHCDVASDPKNSLEKRAFPKDTSQFSKQGYRHVPRWCFGYLADDLEVDSHLDTLRANLGNFAL